MKILLFMIFAAALPVPTANAGFGSALLRTGSPEGLLAEPPAVARPVPGAPAGPPALRSPDPSLWEGEVRGLGEPAETASANSDPTAIGGGSGERLAALRHPAWSVPDGSSHLRC